MNKLTSLPQLNLDEAINKHNELYEKIIKHIAEHGITIIDDGVSFQEPPKKLCAECVKNIKEYVKSGRVSRMIGGIA